MASLIPYTVVSLAIVSIVAMAIALYIKSSVIRDQQALSFVNVLLVFFLLNLAFTGTFILRDVKTFNLVTTFSNVLAMLMPVTIYMAVAIRAQAPVKTSGLKIVGLVIIYTFGIFALANLLEKSHIVRISIMHAVQFYFCARIITTLLRYEANWRTIDKLMYYGVMFSILSFIVSIIFTVSSKNWPMYFFTLYCVLNSLVIMSVPLMRLLIKENETV